MRALSLLQPWPWAIFYEDKDVENRSRCLKKDPTPEVIAIHASAGWDEQGWNYLAILHRNGHIKQRPPLKFEDSKAPRRAIVGITTIQGFQALDQIEERGIWHFGPFCAPLGQPIRLEKLIPYKGNLGFFELPEEIEATILTDKAIRASCIKDSDVQTIIAAFSHREAGATETAAGQPQRGENNSAKAEVSLGERRPGNEDHA